MLQAWKQNSSFLLRGSASSFQRKTACASKKEIKKIKLKKSAPFRWWNSSNVKVIIPDWGKMKKKLKQSVFLVHDTIDKIKLKKPLFCYILQYGFENHWFFKIFSASSYQRKTTWLRAIHCFHILHSTEFLFFWVLQKWPFDRREVQSHRGTGLSQVKG